MLIAEWRKIVRKAWSFRLIVISGLFSTAEMVIPLFVDLFPRYLFLALALLATVGAAVMRVWSQKAFR